MQDDVHQQDEEHQQHDHPRDHQAEVAYAAAELGLRRPRGQSLGNLAERGIFAGAHDDRGADARLNRGPQKDAVGGVGHAVLARRKIGRRLIDGQRLPGEGRLAHVQVLGVQQTGIGRRQIAGIEPDDIAGDQFRHRQLPLLAIAQNRGSGGDLLPNILHRVPCLKLHVEVHDHAEQDDGDDDRAADRIAQHDRDGAGRQENQDQRIGEETQESRAGRRSATLPRGCSGRAGAVAVSPRRRSAPSELLRAAFSSSASGMSQKRSNVLFDLSMSSLSRGRDLGCMAGAKCRVSGLSPSRAV